jgi:hypothetical protein
MRTYTKNYKSFLGSSIEGKSPAYVVGFTIAFLFFAASVLLIKAWLFQLILSWFAVKLLLWQCALLIIFIESFLP